MCAHDALHHIWHHHTLSFKQWVSLCTICHTSTISPPLSSWMWENLPVLQTSLPPSRLTMHCRSEEGHNSHNKHLQNRLTWTSRRSFWTSNWIRNRAQKSQCCDVEIHGSTNLELLAVHGGDVGLLSDGKGVGHSLPRCLGGDNKVVTLLLDLSNGLDALGHLDDVFWKFWQAKRTFLSSIHAQWNVQASAVWLYLTSEWCNCIKGFQI